MSDLYFNEECDCFNEYTYDNEVFWSTIFQPFQIEPGQKKTCGNESRQPSHHPVLMGICPTISYVC